ncbi:MAG TPA: M13 family metallopeptidase [Patescibacteria group bacterium]|jgi:putative endopeptidase|nr:M13 family metallopeptidase [Patescibacteria group bacterium]
MLKNTGSASLAERLSDNVRPQDDFFEYVNASWLKANPIPNSESSWGSFSVLRDQALHHMKQIYEDLSDKPSLDISSIEQQARDLYYTAMHADDFEEQHLDIIQKYFKKIDSIQNTTTLSAIIGELQVIGIGAPWGVGVDSDDKNSKRHLLRFSQSGLTLPDRDYYLTDNQAMQDIRQAYRAHLDKIQASFKNIIEGSKALQDVVVEFEIQLAKHSRSSADLRDVEANYNLTTYAQLQQSYTNIDWQAYADALGWQADDKINVGQPEFLDFINSLFNESNLATWRTYLKWQFLAVYYGRISEKFAQLKFEFFGITLNGTKEILPKWKRTVSLMDHLMGEGVGKLYAAKHFPESSKKQMLDLVQLLSDTYKKRIEQLDWMEQPTKDYALKKLANIKVLVGYPDEWRDFSGLKIGRESFIDNILIAEKFQTAYYMEKLHQPTSREDWFMYPQTVNAYHDPNRLVICFPAAILQSPFFDPKAPMAINLGGIGTVIGHELTHGFDDQGCQFDADGNVRNWQTEKDHAKFDKKAQVIIDQADKFEVLPGLCMQGKLVIGESIADLGGLEIAYDALTSSHKHQSDSTGEDLKDNQLFFINYAVTECNRIRPEKIREYALSDPHPASGFRVNGMLQHVDGFYEAFDVVKTDKLYRSPVERAKIW